MSYIEQTRKEIIEAYVFLRTNNMTIPSETLEFMKDSSLKALDQALTIPVVVKQSELLCKCTTKILPDGNIQLRLCKKCAKEEGFA